MWVGRRCVNTPARDRSRARPMDERLQAQKGANVRRHARSPKPFDIDLLREFLEYDPTSPTGLRWIKRTTTRVKVGEPAGRPNSGGYYRVCLHGRDYRNSRVVYALVNNVDPGDQFIDHIDRNPGNNRIENLRLVSQRVNMQNRVNNSRWGIGAYFHPHSGKWQSTIMMKGKRRLLGYFDTPEAAADAYRCASEALSFDIQ